MIRRFTPGLLAAALLAAGSAQAYAQDLNVWWNKSYYPEEDEEFARIVKQFEDESGLDVEYSLFTNEDVPRKVLAALAANEPPDLAFGFLFDLQYTPLWAYEGRLADVSDVIEPYKDEFLPVALESVNLLNGETGERSYYAIPTQQQTEHIHYWDSLLQEAGLSSDQIPTEWEAFWDFWCQEAQPAVREATGNRRLYGVGHPMSSSASDTFFSFLMFLNAYDAELVDEEGNLVADQPENREGIIKALESYTKPFQNGCVPPGAVNWGDADNNVNFLNQVTVMTPNPSMSIPASQYTQNPENYNENVRTVLWPDKPGGEPIEYMTSIKTALIFEQAQNPEGAKEFMRFLLKPENLGPYLEGSIGRWFPVTKSLIESPYWAQTDDPHRQAHYRTYTEFEQEPFPTIYNHRFAQVQAENAFGKAIGRVALEGASPEEAADELIARMKEVMGTS